MTLSSSSCLDLDLSYTNLTLVPSDLSPQVTTLDLSHNNLTIIPNQAFISMTNLTTLDLTNNQIDAIEDGAFHGLLRLEVLKLTDNQLRKIPNVSYVPNLLKLVMAGNPISVITQKELEFPKYLIFFLASWTSVKHIPPFPIVHNLTSLYLRGNGVKELSLDFFKNIPNLVKLYVAYNNLPSFPEFGYGKENLAILEMKNNWLYRIPDLSGYNNLEVLDISNNFISAVPESSMLMTVSGTIKLEGNPMPCDHELCWLVDDGSSITVNLICPDGSQWVDIHRDVLCEGLCMNSMARYFNWLTTSP